MNDERTPWECQCLADQMRRQLEIYSPKQLAAKLAISQRNVMAAIRSKKLRAHRVNARVYQIESPDAARWWISLAE
jgi:hypothetical protein